MAIVANKTTEFGDILFISTSVPAIGIVTLMSFMDSTIGENNDKYFQKQFRYSLNGITWSAWKDLNNINIQEINVSLRDTLYLEYKYKQVGDGQLAFNSVTVEGTYTPFPDLFYYSQSVFNIYFKDMNIDVIKWYINVTEKLYSDELARYVSFDDGNGSKIDSIAFWQSIAKVFAFYVTLAKVFNRFYENYDITNSFLTQRGLKLSNGNTLIELNSLLRDFNKEMFRRGTAQQFNTKAENGGKYDGEILRMLGITGDDEFIIDYFLPEHCGWWIDNASPLYKGLDNHLNAQKLDLDSLHTTGTVVKSGALNDVVINISSSSTTPSGIKKQNFNNLIPANYTQNYCLEFDLQIVNSNNMRFSLGMECVNNLNQDISALRSMKDLTLTNYALNDVDLSTLSVDSNGWARIKMIVYNKDMAKPFSQDALNVKIGNNLIFMVDIFKFYPVILVKNGEVNIKNLILRPLISETEHGFINMNNFVSIWV